tara:strand:+ start:396 stop:1250 length:855 start_codon:yes stop_codon:yes gene_type:complete
MSKYNLTDILNEYIGGGRIGTLNISFRDLLTKMDDLEKSGKVVVRTLSGPSGDGKVNREFEVVTNRSAVPGGKEQERGFTVYDYKFGFDPGSEEHFMEEYPFSVGGNDLELAMELIDGVKPLGLNEKNEKMDELMYIDDDGFEREMGRSKKDSLKKEMAIHVDQLLDGNIDMNDFMNVVEDIMAELNSMKEVMGIDRKGRKKPESKSNMTKVNEEEMISKAKYDKLLDNAAGRYDELEMQFTKFIKDEYNKDFDIDDFRQFQVDNSIMEDKDIAKLKENFKRFM